MEYLGAVHLVILQRVPVWAPQLVGIFSFVGGIAVIGFMHESIKELLG
ncbi:MAG: hypothetical protein V5A68_08365 [Candidatus Thermoplasmatota archaeon]